jgi:probable HAF family extracellular repeat protein
MVRDLGSMSKIRFRQLSVVVALTVALFLCWNAYSVWQYNRSNWEDPVRARQESKTGVAPSHYGFVDLGTPGNDYVYHGGDVNDNHIAVGTGSDKNSKETGFRWQSGHLEPLNDSDNGSCVLAINLNDVAVGYSLTQAGQSPAKWVRKTYSLLPMPQGTIGGEAVGINNKGQIAGRAYTEPFETAWWNRPTIPIEWDGDRIEILPLPSGYRSGSGYAISDAGTVAGWAITQDDRTQAVIWKDGKMTDLGALPGGRLSRAASINSKGWVVGSAEKAPIGPIVFGKPARPDVHGFVWHDGNMYDLGVPREAIYCEATSINNLGVVVGQYCTVNISDRRGFVWDSAHGNRDLSGLVYPQNWIIGQAFAINNCGEILTYARPRKRGGHFFAHLLLLKPQ